MAADRLIWTGGRSVRRWTVVRSEDGRWLPRLRAEWAAFWRCGRRGHRYERPGVRVQVFDDPPPGSRPWENDLVLRRCLNGCGCALEGLPDPLPPRKVHHWR